MPALVDFLLNRTDDEATPTEPVAAPAFSLTKVLSSAALVLTPLTAILVRYLADATFSTWQVVVLIVGVLGFLAVTASADVLVRARAAVLARPTPVPYSELDPVLRATLVTVREDPTVEVFAIRPGDAGSQFLVREEGQPMSWVAQADLRF